MNRDPARRPLSCSQPSIAGPRPPPRRLDGRDLRGPARSRVRLALLLPARWLVLQLLANGPLQQVVQPFAMGAAFGIHPLAVLIVTIAGWVLLCTVCLITRPARRRRFLCVFCRRPRRGRRGRDEPAACQRRCGAPRRADPARRTRVRALVLPALACVRRSAPAIPAARAATPTTSAAGGPHEPVLAPLYFTAGEQLRELPRPRLVAGGNRAGACRRAAREPRRRPAL